VVLTNQTYKKMKKIILLLACTMISTAVIAQGTVIFGNTKPTKQKITDSAGDGLVGGWAQLYAGTTADSLTAVGEKAAIYDDKAAKYGYFSGGVVEVPFTGSGFFQVKAWQGAATFEAATLSGSSNVFSLTPGYESDPTKPPALPSDLAGLQSFTVVPEPGTIALAVLGLAAFFVRRRK